MLVFGLALLLSGHSPRLPALRAEPGVHLTVTATAYCQRGRTQAGTPAQSGMVAADPRVLPVGSVVRVYAPGSSYQGIYTVMDTGSAVKGRKIDIFMASCTSATRFGHRSVWVYVLRTGWNPQLSAANN
jgi:3D (Asp-Asp-Asp) domain-containing protein